MTNQIKNSSSFDKIELLNYQTTGGELGLGVIDETFFESIKEKLVIKEPVVDTTIYTEDTTPQPYRIRVYKLNSVSGNCWAYFYPNPNDDEGVYQLPIVINKGDKEYNNSIFSRSLHEERTIDIKGIAERINGRVSQITVDL